METAVFHPQDCLTVRHSDRHHKCPSSVAKPGGRAISATHEASIPATKCVRDVAMGSTIRNQGHGLLGRKNASAGLLPLPDQASQSAHSSFRSLAPKISPCRSVEIADPYSNFRSYTSDVHIFRYASVPMLDYAARTRRFFSECFPLHAAQLHERKLPRSDEKFFLNSAQGNCMAGSSPCAARAALSCQKLKSLENSDFSDVFNPVRPKWVDCTDQGVHYRKRMYPELSQVEVYLGGRCAKPPFKVLPDGQGESICTNENTVGRKHGVNKQLKRSASEKRQQMLELPILQRPGSAIKRTTNLFEGVVGSHRAKSRSSKIEVKLASSAPPASSLEGKREKSLQMQASSDIDTQGRMGVFKTGVTRSQATVSQQMRGIERNVGASLHGQCYGSVNAAVEHKEEPDRVTGLEGISRTLNSVLDNGEMWVMDDERWAGPSFFNSPSPSSLPVPSFTFKFTRTASNGSIPTKTADYGAHIFSDNSLLEAKCSRDVAFVTKDLRRMLNLDHASCNL